MKPIKEQFWLSYDGYPFQVVDSAVSAIKLIDAISSKSDFDGDRDKFGLVLVKCYDCSYKLVSNVNV